MIGSVNAGSTAVRSVEVPKTSNESKTPIEPRTEGSGHVMPTKAESRANFLAKYSLSPKEAFASSAELGPPTGTGRADNQASKIHTEIKVNGKVIARVYNSGGVEIVNEYAFLSEGLGFGDDTAVGPELAADRANRLKEALEGYGAVVGGDEQDVAGGLSSGTGSQRPILEILQASTAQTQEEWWHEEGRHRQLDPGSVFSHTA